MLIAKGKGVSPGIAIGVLSFFKRVDTNIAAAFSQDTQAELQRFESAKAKAAAQLSELSVVMEEKIGKDNSLLFEIHKMMLEDLDYIESVQGMIKNNTYTAEYAVSETSKQFSAMMAEMDDEYMRERAADVADVSRRVIELLLGKQQDIALPQTPCIFGSNDFAPSETARFDRELVLGLVTSGGASNSHTAIFARTMGIPAVIALGSQLKPDFEEQTVIIDGFSGDVILGPDDATLQQYRAMQQNHAEKSAQLEKYRGKIAKTKSGKRIKIYANIGNVQDAEIAMQSNAEGIGLFRSEFLYLESDNYPSEEKQFEAYKAVAEKMEGRTVIIRTLDIGADKQASYFKLPKEENPALGMRAIRICLTRPEIFKTQLRAIYRASAFGKIAIMLPMITSVEELRKAKELSEEVKAELTESGIAFDKNIEFGIMIETPASAIISDLLAKEADFFSVGTNDLTQYTLAIDRQNDSVAVFCNEHHEAILRLIKLAADSAHANGIWVGICGELAADETLTKRFVEMGIDELSVAPSSVLKLQQIICDME